MDANATKPFRVASASLSRMVKALPDIDLSERNPLCFQATANSVSSRILGGWKPATKCF